MPPAARSTGTTRIPELDAFRGIAAVGVVLFHAFPALFFLGWIWFAIEANGLRRWTYLVRGWRLIDVIEGRNLREAEIRYFHSFEARMPEVPPPAPPISAE